MKNYNIKNQYSDLIIKFHNETMEYSKKQNSFLKKDFYINSRTGEIINLSFSVENWFKNQSSVVLQRTLYMKTLSREKKLFPIFITFTNPSEYNPFHTYNKGSDFRKWTINKKYKFDDLEEGMRESYNNLYNVWRRFYFLVKKGNRDFFEESKEIEYIQSIEFMKSLTPHSHSLLFVPENMKDYVIYCFNQVLEEFGLNKKGNDIKYDFDKYEYKKGQDKYDGVSNYIIKYITKNLEENQNNFGEFQSMIFGWKRKLGNRVRLFRSSNTKISMEVYKKVYHSMTTELKEELIQKSKDNNTCLLWELEKIVKYKKDYVKKEGLGTYNIKTMKEDVKEVLIRSKIYNEEIKNPLFEVYFKKEVIENLKVVDDNIDIDLQWCLNEGDIYDMFHLQGKYELYRSMDEEFGEDEYIYDYKKSYRVLECVVKCKDIEIYNKDDWNLTTYFNNFEEVEEELVS